MWGALVGQERVPASVTVRSSATCRTQDAGTGASPGPEEKRGIRGLVSPRLRSPGPSQRAASEDGAMTPAAPRSVPAAAVRAGNAPGGTERISEQIAYIRRVMAHEGV